MKTSSNSIHRSMFVTAKAAVRASIFASVALLCVFPARSEVPADQAVCTTAPRSQWIAESKIRTSFGVNNYIVADLHVSKQNCYEFYAIHKNGDIVEAYYNPVTGELVRFTRLSKTGEQIEASDATSVTKKSMK